MAKLSKITNESESMTPFLDKDRLLKSIFRISFFLTVPTDLDEILQKILDEVVDSIGFDRGIIRLFDESKRYLVAKVTKNYSPDEEKVAFSMALNIDEHTCVAAKVAKTGQPIVIENAETDPRITETDRMLTKIYHKGSIFCAPLKISDEVIGIIAAWREEETKFFLEEINLFLAFASQVSIIIHAARLFENNAEKIRQLMVLQEAVSDMNFLYTRYNRILGILVRSILKIVGDGRIMGVSLDLVGNRCFVNDGKQVFAEDRKDLEKRLAGTIMEEALDTNCVTIRDAFHVNPTFRTVFEGYPSEIAIPLHVKDKFKGVFFVAKKTGSYSQDQINVLDILVRNAAVSYDNAVMHGILSQEAESLKTEVEKLKEREDILLGFHDILGKSEKMISMFHVIEDVAKHNTNILIQGESGTGKELFARAIHRQSNRNLKSFVEVNCAAIPGTLLESELFGYEAGAFTDAKKRKIGLLEYASGGTLLLDEIGEMSIQLQAKFLRMLEDGHIRRLGGTENVPVDVRFIFSTNRDLSQMVSEGSFREDLFYRISVVPIVIPPLRERDEDILLLARHYVDEFNNKFRKNVRGFDKEAENIMKLHHWPGNVRELRNIIERIMIVQNVEDTITGENFPAEIKGTSYDDEMKAWLEHPLVRLPAEGMDYSDTIERISNDIKRKLLINAVDRCGGNKTKASKLLGISRYKFMREHGKVVKKTKK
ncbi:MAG: sigma 54-interacting transcriptional regulator [Deltaproteobacteria bacterium]|nr:sigma 54-interacting transcriptional regulator [Deltaproteobacteria bacterium]